MRILIATVPVAAHLNPLTSPSACLVRGGRGGLVAGARIDCSVSRADAPAPLAR